MTVKPGYLINGFSGNARVVRRLTEGLSHADSLLVPSYGGNCLNWILGHIMVSRHRVLNLLALDPLWEADIMALYETGSEPIDEDRAAPFEGMLADLETTSECFAGALGQKTFEELTQALPAENADQSPPTLGQQLLGLYWHESYHIGQMELLRRVAGKTEKVFG